uniref:Uncharacterized protein n=1 Tax=Amazona collaria TaxID=241587 RepID=A0A8B9F4X2_9PSIT
CTEGNRGWDFQTSGYTFTKSHLVGQHQRICHRAGPAQSELLRITCLARLEEVLELVGKCTVPLLQPGQWVVRKYVDQPLTILGTKFHLWQWLLVRNWNPLTVWFYRDSYVSFCSWPFSCTACTGE